MNFSLPERIANRLIVNSPFVPSLGLMNGKTGDVICLYKLHRKTGNKIYEETADSLIDLIIEELNANITHGFFSGLSGIGCGIEYLIQENFIIPATENVLEEIDDAVFQLDRKKYKPSSDVSDFYGAGLYYLMRTCTGNLDWNDAAMKYLVYDLNSIIAKLTDMLADEKAISVVSRTLPVCGKRKSLFVFSETSRAAVYGIGTYINELVACLKSTEFEITDVIGNITSNTILELLYKELLENTAWRKVRDSNPCNKCLYHFLCSSPSDYERVLRRMNLCNINME